MEFWMKKLKDLLQLPIMKKMAEYSKIFCNWLVHDMSTMIYITGLVWSYIIVPSTYVKYSFIMTVTGKPQCLCLYQRSPAYTADVVLLYSVTKFICGQGCHCVCYYRVACQSHAVFSDHRNLPFYVFTVL